MGNVIMKKISSSGIFKDFYCENYIYVDKTEDIYDLISNNKKYSFHALAVLESRSF